MKTNAQFILIAVALFFMQPAFAQTPDVKASSQLKSLLKLKGHWESPGATLQADGKRYSFTYYADFESIADNTGLSMHEWCDIPNMGKLNGANLIGVDAQDGKVHWFTVDNMGTTHEHIGEFADDKHFSMVNNSMHDGKSYVETVSLEFDGADRMKLKVLSTLDGKEASVITGDFLRKQGKGQHN
ncbi:MAG TPA: hypothetical protein VK666_10860 [Chryseolinea sp.]|nr:hypothetical protein [Chryseolinea sp.]